MKRQIDLTPYMDSIMRQAELASERDYLVLNLIGQGDGFRRGEVVGNEDRREQWKVIDFPRAKKLSERPIRDKILAFLKDNPDVSVEAEDGTYSLVRDGQYVLKMRKENPLPGLQIEDLHDGSIWVKGKGGTEKEQPVPEWLYKRIMAYIGNRKTGPIFPELTAKMVYYLVQNLAKAAGVKDWRLVHPHSFRRYYAKYVYNKSNHDINMTQHLMRHKDPKMTLHYVGEPDISEKKRFIETLSVDKGKREP